MDARTILGVLLMDGGLLAAALGLGSLIKPPRRLGIASRRRAALVACAGAVLVLAAVALPAPLLRSARGGRAVRSAQSAGAVRSAQSARAARIDEFVPVFQFHESHQIRIHATPRRIAWAIATVPAEEITLFRTLTWLRHPRLPWSRPEESILAPPPGKPILEVATASGFLPLADEADREIVLGSLVFASRSCECDSPRAFKELATPGYAKAVINFLIEPQAAAAVAGRDTPGASEGWCRLTTETRVFATDAATCRRFGAYWRLIAPGSALIRVEWLRAIRRRAEG
jgi:hypothetical protein